MNKLQQKEDADTTSLAADEEKIILNATVTPKLSLAQQQNSVPVINDLYVENNTENDLQNIELCLVSDPLFLTTKIWHIDRIASGNRFHIRDVNVEISRKYLAELRETIKGSLSLSLRQDGQEIAHLFISIDVLTPDEWGGIGYLPELTAAFCCPNDPAISTLMKEAADCLGKAGESLNKFT